VSNNVISGIFSVGTTTCSGNTDYTFSNVPATGACTVGTWNGQAIPVGVKLYKAPAYPPAPAAPTTSGASEAATAAAAVVGAAAAIVMAARV
jgi:hypothetical protein